VLEADAVLVDLYDTLVSGDWARLRAQVSHRTGLPATQLDEAYDRTRPARNAGAYGTAEEEMSAVVVACGLEPEPVLVAELLEIERAFLRDGIHLYDDSLLVLQELRARGIRTAIVSNCDHPTRGLVERLGLSDEVDAVVLSFEVRAAKPDARIYQVALERLDTRAGRSVFVDDQPGFCDGAVAFGLRAMLIARDRAEPAPMSAHEVIRDLEALLA
jgi:HAD superfamily hydrolase (TIGR01509 family)